MSEFDLNRLGNIIYDHSEKSKEEIEKRVKLKKERYDGLVNTEAALFLVARDLNVNLQEKLKIEDLELDIENLVEDMNSVDIKVRVNRVEDTNYFENDNGEGRVRNIHIGDDTGATQLVLWNEDVEIGEDIEPGDQLYIKNGYTKYSDYDDEVQINMGDDGELKVLS